MPLDDPQIHKEISVVLSNRAQAHANMGDKDKAITDCEAAVKLDPSNYKAWYRLFTFPLMPPPDRMRTDLTPWNRELALASAITETEKADMQEAIRNWDSRLGW